MNQRNLSKDYIIRQIDKYDGQRIFSQQDIIYELGSYLGGGASGAVYEAIQFTNLHNNQSIHPNLHGKQIAVKILNPIGYKSSPSSYINGKCITVKKGSPCIANDKNRFVLTKENVWWIYNPSIKQLFGAYLDPLRGNQLRELTLSKCVEIWGFLPLGENQHYLSEVELERRNNIRENICIDGHQITLTHVPSKYLKWLRTRETICREMKSMKIISGHPNIIELHEVLELIQDSKSTLFLVLDLANGGMLFERIKARTNSSNISNEDYARKYFIQLISGLEYCHSKGVVHRDLKPENLLLSDISENAVLKIADFGFSTMIFSDQSNSNSGQIPLSSRIPCDTGSPPRKNNVTDDQSDANEATTPLRRLKSVVGSPYHMAPEIGGDDTRGYDGRKVDMWSAGVILFSLLTGNMPFSNQIKQCTRYKRYKQWIYSDYVLMLREHKPVRLPLWFTTIPVSAAVGSLLVRLLHPDPNCRITASQAARHPWCEADELCSLELDGIDTFDSIECSSQYPLSPPDSMESLANMTAMSPFVEQQQQVNEDHGKVSQSNKAPKNNVIGNTIQPTRLFREQELKEQEYYSRLGQITTMQPNSSLPLPIPPPCDLTATESTGLSLDNHFEALSLNPPSPDSHRQQHM